MNFGSCPMYGIKSSASRRVSNFIWLVVVPSLQPLYGSRRTLLSTTSSTSFCGSASNPNTVVAPSRRPIFRRAAPFAQTILSIAVIFGLDHAQYITLLPKSITTPIDLCVSDELGGIRSITVAAIILTGIFGNISADWICRKFKIINPISKGLAIGNCAHTIGTTKTFEMGGVAVLLAGIITVFAAAVFAALY